MRKFLGAAILSLLLTLAISACSNAAIGGIAEGATLMFDAENVDDNGNPPTSQTAPSSWQDISGTGSDGFILNLDTALAGFGWQGDGGGATPYHLAFDGDASNINVITTLNVSETAMPSSTWLVWVKPMRDPASGVQQILSSEAGGFDRSLLISGASNKFSIYTGPGPFAIWTPLTAPNYTMDAWHFVAVVFRADDIYFYMNGNQHSFSETGDEPNYDATPTLSLRLGAATTGLANTALEGGIAWAAVYNRELSAGEIQSTCEDLQARFSGAATTCL